MIDCMAGEVPIEPVFFFEHVGKVHNSPNSLRIEIKNYPILMTMGRMY
jgi:hypothetical protein